eukprot:TRINITY_DN1990_c0_g4_i1.p1 TRINITY_DN1990_c0_g4~~TRINITY_DN1990_c0_g4_i1.p1  ORF type:complete len:1977 (+),score=625.68 TRINITY_DN1990_c0_g4_i1:43-5973(+)
MGTPVKAGKATFAETSSPTMHSPAMTGMDVARTLELKKYPLKHRAATHLKLTVQRNLRLKSRKPCGSCCEVLWAPFFMLILASIQGLAGTFEHKGGSVYDDSALNMSSLVGSTFCFDNAIDPDMPNPLGMEACPALVWNDVALPVPVWDQKLKIRLDKVPILPPGINVNPAGGEAGLASLVQTHLPSTLVDFDSYLIYQHALAKLAASRASDDSARWKRAALEAIFHSGTLEFALGGGAPCEEVQRVIRNMNASWTMFNSAYNDTRTKSQPCPGVWETEAAAVDWATSLEGSNTVWALVVLNTADEAEKALDFTIRMNITATPQTKKTQGNITGLGSEPHKTYLFSGFIALEGAVTAAFMDSPGPWRQLSETLQSPMPYGGYVVSEFYARAKHVIPLFLSFSYSLLVSRLVSALVTEKEERLREGLLIMGLSRNAFFGSWYLTYCLVTIVSSLLVSAFGCMFFPNSSAVLVFGLFLCYGQSLIGMSMMFSTIFNKARIAAVVAPILLMVCAAPKFMLGEKASLTADYVMCLLSPNAFAIGMQIICASESFGVGTGWKDLYSGDLSFAYVLFMLLVDTVVYMLIGRYLEDVLPSEWGVRKHPLYFLPRFRRLRPVKTDPDWVTPSPVVQEPDSNTEKSGVRITKLTKTFPGKDSPAVDGLGTGLPDDTLSFKEGRIQVILGHNGAGKTTTINLLTGMLRADSGDCEIFGKSILTDMSAIREDLGLCPQHNILWADLTCREHLRYFGALKGVPKAGGVLEDLVVKMLVLVNLASKADAYSSQLSGGQKRKLSVAIALIGGPRLVFLDEPTAGMDVESRRAMWELLRKPSVLKDRCIVLTTHYMDEADILGDSIAIMDRGRLHSLGSPFYLKQKLGAGYNLSIVMRKGCGIQDLLTTVQHSVPAARYLSASGNELRLQLPLYTDLSDGDVEASALAGELQNELLLAPPAERVEKLIAAIKVKKDTVDMDASTTFSGEDSAMQALLESARAQGSFPPLFEALETLKGKKRGIEGFGIGIITLEEIFMKIALQSTLVTPSSPAMMKQGRRHDSMSPGESLNDTASGLRTNPSGQLPASFGSRVTPPRTPVMIDAALDNDLATKSFAGAGTKGSHLYSVGADHDAAKKPLEGVALSLRQFQALFRKRLCVARRDKRTICVQFFLPVLFIIFALWLSSFPLPQQPDLYLTASQYESSPLGVLLSAPPGGASSAPFAGCPTTDTSTCAFDGSGYSVMAATDAHNASELNDRYQRELYAHEGVDQVFGYAADSAVSQDDVYPPTEGGPTSVALIFHNATYNTGLPSAFLAMLNAAAKKAFGEAAYVRVSNHPFPISEFLQQVIEAVQILVSALIILLPFTVLPSNYVSFVVRERENKAKTVQLISGVRPTVYWAASYAFDFCAFCCTTVLCLVVFLIFSRSEFVGNVETFFATLCLFLSYGLASIAFSYAGSFLYQKHTVAQTSWCVINFVGGFVLVITSYILDNLDETASTNHSLKYIWRLFPCYSLGNGIIQLSLSSPDVAPLFAYLGRETPSVWDWDGVVVECVFLLAMVPVYLSVVYAAETLPQWIRAKRAAMTKSAAAAAEDPDCEIPLIETNGAHGDSEGADVKQEADEILSGAAGECSVVVKHLKKAWPVPTGKKIKVAVDDVTFGVRHGELFAFLGTNGAGKTTTISMLSGDVPPTSGSATVAGYDIVSQLDDARRHIGLCPQFDALLDQMTADEHLLMYSDLRGIPRDEAKASIETLVASFGLAEHRTKPTKTLSGGNKRKLSVAISLIGGPSVVFLDEPSAGMDPVARRGLWSALQDACQERSVVLTTHHLEEVEGLSHLRHRVSIMVDAKLQCIGSLQQLKSRHGDAYELSLRAKSARAEERIKAFITDAYPASMLTEATHQRLTYRIPLPLTLSSVFRNIEEHRRELGVTDYSIAETSLEQVFIRISERAQRDEEGIDVHALAAAGSPAPGEREDVGEYQSPLLDNNGDEVVL